MSVGVVFALGWLLLFSGSIRVNTASLQNIWCIILYRLSLCLSLFLRFIVIGQSCLVNIITAVDVIGVMRLLILNELLRQAYTIIFHMSTWISFRRACCSLMSLINLEAIWVFLLGRSLIHLNILDRDGVFDICQLINVFLGVHGWFAIGCQIYILHARCSLLVIDIVARHLYWKSKRLLIWYIHIMVFIFQAGAFNFFLGTFWVIFLSLLRLIIRIVHNSAMMILVYHLLLHVNEQVYILHWLSRIPIDEFKKLFIFGFAVVAL